MKRLAYIISTFLILAGMYGGNAVANSDLVFCQNVKTGHVYLTVTGYGSTCSHGDRVIGEAEYNRGKQVDFQTSGEITGKTQFCVDQKNKYRLYFYKTYEGKTCVPGDRQITKKEFLDKNLRTSSTASSSSSIASTTTQAAQTTTAQTASGCKAIESDYERDLWNSVKDSGDPEEYQIYLDECPTGTFAKLATSRIKKFSSGGTTTSVAQSSIPNLDYGRYHALVIGNNDYDHLPNLKTAVNDATKVASVLENNYGFSVKLLKNASRSNIVSALSAFRKTISRDNNFLLYYAGHGHLDEAANEGYWLPVDAELDDPSNWLQNDTIVAQLRAMEAKHVMVVADSCFSGTITRGINIEQRTPEWLRKIVKKKARIALTSGGLEPVSDFGGGSHSSFAKVFISLLEENTDVLDASQLFSQLRPKVMVNSTQTPEFGKIHLAGDDGGDFLFVRQ